MTEGMISVTYRHSDGSGGHSFYPGVVGEPEWNPVTNELTVHFADGSSLTFGPNPEGEPIAYGRLLFRDDSIDEETGLPMMGPGDPERILLNCTYWPVGES